MKNSEVGAIVKIKTAPMQYGVVIDVCETGKNGKFYIVKVIHSDDEYGFFANITIPFSRKELIFKKSYNSIWMRRRLKKYLSRKNDLE